MYERGKLATFTAAGVAMAAVMVCAVRDQERIRAETAAAARARAEEAATAAAAKRAEEEARWRREKEERLSAAREDAKLFKKLSDGLGMSSVLLQAEVDELSPWVLMVAVLEPWWEQLGPQGKRDTTRQLRQTWANFHGQAAGGREKCRVRIYASYPGGVRKVAETRIIDPDGVDLTD